MNKKRLCLYAFCLCFITLSGQEKGFFSAEVDANYYYYLALDNNFNSGYSFLVSYSSGKIKLSSGINYATKNTFVDFNPELSTGYLEKRDYNLEYLNFPLFITFKGRSTKNIKINGYGGIIFNNILNYRLTSYYTDKPSLIEDNPDIGQKTGTTLRFGVNINKSLSQRWVLNLSPFFDYQFIKDHDEYDRPDPDAYKYPGFEIMTFGLKLGIEHLFRK